MPTISAISQAKQLANYYNKNSLTDGYWKLENGTFTVVSKNIFSFLSNIRSIRRATDSLHKAEILHGRPFFASVSNTFIGVQSLLLLRQQELIKQVEEIIGKERCQLIASTSKEIEKAKNGEYADKVVIWRNIDDTITIRLPHSGKYKNQVLVWKTKGNTITGKEIKLSNELEIDRIASGLIDISLLGYSSDELEVKEPSTSSKNSYLQQAEVLRAKYVIDRSFQFLNSYDV